MVAHGWTIFAIAAVLCLVSTPAISQPADGSPSGGLVRSTPEPIAENYFCDHVLATAEATQPSFLSPEFYAQAGWTRDPLAGQDDNPFEEIRARVTIGGRYGFVNIVRNRLTHRQAAAQCRSYRAESRLQLYMLSAHTIGLREEFAAREAALLDAIEEARVRYEEAAERMRQGEGTITDAYNLQVEMDAFVTLLQQNRFELAPVNQLPEILEGDPQLTVQAYLDAEYDLLHTEQELQQSELWEIEAHVAYDKIINTDDVRLPLGATVMFSFNFGRLFQADAYERARDARRAGLAAEELSYGHQLERLRLSLGQLHDDVSTRLETIDELIALIGEQLDFASAFEGHEAQLHRDRLRFDQLELEVEKAGLTARLQHLETFLLQFSQSTPR